MDHLRTLGWVRLTHHPRSWASPARTLLGVSDYESLVELAAKGMAERDRHPMPKSVRTPEAFYEVMARAALDAAGLQALLEELARAEQELKTADEGPTLSVTADAPMTLLEQPSAPVARNDYENGLLDTRIRRDRGTSKADKARLRREWTIIAEDRLAVVTAAVERLRKVFNIAAGDAVRAFRESCVSRGSCVRRSHRLRQPRRLAQQHSRTKRFGEGRR